MILISGYEDIKGIDRLVIVSSFLALVIGAFIVSVLVLLKRRKTDVKASRFYLLGIALFAALFGLGRFVFLYHDYFAPDPLDAPVYLVGQIFTLSSLIILAFTIETFIFTKTKRLITVIGAISLVLVVAFSFPPGSISTYAFIAGNGVLTVLPFFIYVYIAKISTGTVRKQAMFIIFGIVMLAISIIGGKFLYDFHVLDRLWSQLFGIIFSFIGFILLSYGLVKTPATK
ncbi:MAG: hypothetical protein JW839_06310 [Candidatus Lokiarchaeota archaeon]|nr:hypothetical protein [Candidatus Lokiarchaeota archaeon]